jgi:hypothetical protein
MRLLAVLATVLLLGGCASARNADVRLDLFQGYDELPVIPDLTPPAAPGSRSSLDQTPTGGSSGSIAAQSPVAEMCCE